MTNIIDSKNHTVLATSWESIDWNKISNSVKELRGKIYKAKKSGNIQLVRRLQDIMLRSNANIIMSIRKVTSINVGKRTPGMDKILIKTNLERWNLFSEIKQLGRSEWVDNAKPTKRIYIPKPNGQLRPLGIPTIKDRVIQNIVKNALEPEWEAVFESSSYGFRPGRSCHDALSRIYLTTARQKKRLWVLDADIKGCFDNIDHKCILDLISDFPAKNVVNAWLQAGYCEFPSTDVIETNTDTPQGGVISPLLANIALHGMQEVLGIKTVATTGHNYGNNKYAFVRYADDFVVLSESKEACEQAKILLEKWLKTRGLDFASEKVHITHLTEGIKFLGCSVRLYGNVKQKLLIKPHPEKITAFKNRLKDIWLKQKGQSPPLAINLLNPIIRGWANYYRPFVSSEVFASLDHFMWHRAWRFAKRRHPQKNHHWIANRYFGQKEESISKNNWRFFGYIKENEKLFLLRFSDFKIQRHVIVKNNMVPDDRSPESIAYWDNRSANKQYLVWGNYESRQKLAKKQFHLCPNCNESLYNEEELHIHHIKSKKQGGKDSYGNLVIVHELCHRQIHSLKLSEVDVRNKILDIRKKMKAQLGPYKER
jgi:RNA-directed DNA polymerase